MSYFIHTVLVIGTFLLMEGVAWATHKYVMHGPLWSWHRSHHKKHPHVLERNDLFALVFSLPSILLIVLGFELSGWAWLKYVGFGIMGYGLFYFIFHDIIVHRRIHIPYKTKNKYMKRIMKAHYVHHETHTKEDAEAFGFLYAPKKYAVGEDQTIRRKY
ncbi:MAG: sterol desaturase family protein [Marinoscillum sp.]|uniref:beta-carotene hydroxylase n=1 Tax=Marinoscillum sp. TaxID=2024838 RepID=UPI0033017438